jgi:hypothetical protein
VYYCNVALCLKSKTVDCRGAGSTQHIYKRSETFLSSRVVPLFFFCTTMEMEYRVESDNDDVIASHRIASNRDFARKGDLCGKKGLAVSLSYY